MIYKIDEPELEHNFVEFSDSWSRKQTRAAWAAFDALPTSIADADAQAKAEEASAKLLNALRPKIVALHLDCEGADPITTPADLTLERLEDMDERVYRWWINVWMVHLGALTRMGNALGRRLYATQDTSNSTQTTDRPENQTS